MNGPTGFDHLLNRPGDEVAYSQSRAAIPNRSPTRRTSISQSQRAHKYSDSQSSTSSFASSTNNNFGSHSRNPSYSTTASTPPSANSITGHFPSHYNFETTRESSSKMADMADSMEDREKRPRRPTERPQSHATRFANSAIELTEEDRAESPTDVAMPMIRRAPAMPSETSSAFHDAANAQRGSTSNTAGSQRGPQQAVPSAPIVPIVLSESLDAGRTALASTSAAGPSAAGPPARIFHATPGYHPAGGPALRLWQTLIDSAIPRLCPDVATLMREIDFHQERACKFMDDCIITRGLDIAKIPMRKSMSHVFGRNKNCTRCIPDYLWIWVCRKHYQRARYRNDHDYNIKMTQVVEMQVLRLEAWSNYNQDRGAPEDGVVVDWTLAVRRREQLRMNEESRKRKGSIKDEDEDDEEGDDSSPGPTATDSGLVPDWLLAMVGPGKSTIEIQEIIARIYRELQNHTLTHFPDIEILPNITGERVKPKHNRAKPGAGKKAAVAAKNVPQNKKQRANDVERRQGPAHPEGRFNFGLNGQGPAANAPFAGERFGYSNAPGYQAHYPSGGHHRSASWDTNSYNPFQAGSSGASYPQPSHGFGGYGQGPSHGTEYNGYLAAQVAQPAPPQNGYWTPDYDARLQQRQQQQQQQQQAAYSSAGYYQSGTHQGGPPPVSAAKHSRNLSTPVRPSPTMMGAGERPQESLRASRYEEQPAAAGYPAGSYPAPVLSQPSHRYRTYTGLPAPGSSSDNIPRASGYGVTPGGSAATPTRLPVRGGPPAPSSSSAAPPVPEGYEGYPPLPHRR
ncbi:hypothetical protein C8A01DRAFT_13698 [Parachaetomium inaequale]|uniref:Uncharacterized protein n=1 Tax=Parachaetomium inaequale TaxID=2588326 RepID=A0AAN6PPQ7_9PEZI|nr:hypothetical protein C8A01DRAFT_13698 [Parachaetomium inaequale]